LFSPVVATAFLVFLKIVPCELKRTYLLHWLGSELYR
jgi:hypothetical protein